MPTRRRCLVCIGCLAFAPQIEAESPFPVDASPATLPDAIGCGAEQLVRLPGVRRALPSSGWDDVDGLLLTETRQLNRTFRVSPSFTFHDDGDHAEALALRQGDTGAQIYIGIKLVARELRIRGDKWRSSIAGIAAHEWAHAFQYSHPALDEKRFMSETLADYLAGWYLGDRSAAGVDALEPTGFEDFLRSAGRSGDGFHADAYGRPHERIGAMLEGYSRGRNHLSGNRRPDPWEAANAGYLYVSKMGSK